MAMQAGAWAAEGAVIDTPHIAYGLDGSLMKVGLAMPAGSR